MAFPQLNGLQLLNFKSADNFPNEDAAIIFCEEFGLISSKILVLLNAIC